MLQGYRSIIKSLLYLGIFFLFWNSKHNQFLNTPSLYGAAQPLQSAAMFEFWH